MELELRNINLNDYNQYKQHINSNFTFEYFEYFLSNLLNENHVIIIVKKKDKLIASGTLLIEEKLTYNGCKLGHIEATKLLLYYGAKSMKDSVSISI